MSHKAHNFGSRTNIGCVRETNEDALVSQPPLYAVADGMGGHAAGEVASEIAVEILAEHALSIRDSDALINTVRTINRVIIEATKDGRGREGMGTTLTVAILDGVRLLIAQVGDSRAYLLHNRRLQQLTRDHSYVGELLAGGHISAAEAALHPKRSVITRALGSDPKTEADIYELQATVGDRLLVCTDGLYGMVSEEDITHILTSTDEPQQACDELIEAARNGGGLDNISVIVVDINNNESEFLNFGNDAFGFEDAFDTRSRRARFQRARRGNAKSGKAGVFKRLHLGILTFLVLLALLVGGAVAGVYWYADSNAFLRTEDNRVVVYRGLPDEVLPGLRLEWYEYTTNVDPADLRPTTAERLKEGVRVDSLSEAASVVSSYEQQIRQSSVRERPSS
ncbi:MAG: Stp1/IreP family PP2C-type Ser/Thr phosphatase [Coriobacteriia bacterium]|nr:Stp1/IreP family PP2C-type Ser/Thr phosphatase [Coriobacteriia bacterium]